MTGTSLPRVPEGLRDLMKIFTKDVLREKPENLYQFSANYFDGIVSEKMPQAMRKYEPVQSYEAIMKNRIRQQVPLSLVFNIIPETLTELIKQFIKAVLKENPENIYVFAREYFHRLSIAKTTQNNRNTNYTTYEKYLEGKENARLAPNQVTCECGRVLSAARTQGAIPLNEQNAQPSPLIIDKDNHQHERSHNVNYLRAVCIIQKHFRQYLKRKNANKKYNSHEYVTAIYIIQRQVRRYLTRKRNAESKSIDQQQSKKNVRQQYDSATYMRAVYVIQRHYRLYRKRQNKRQFKNDTVSLTAAAFIIQRTFRRLMKARRAKKHTAAALDQGDEVNDNASEAGSYTSASTALLSTESAGEHMEFGGNFEESVHQQTIKEDEEVENDYVNFDEKHFEETIKKDGQSINSKMWDSSIGYTGDDEEVEMSRVHIESDLQESTADRLDIKEFDGNVLLKQNKENSIDNGMKTKAKDGLDVDLEKQKLSVNELDLTNIISMNNLNSLQPSHDREEHSFEENSQKTSGNAGSSLEDATEDAALRMESPYREKRDIEDPNIGEIKKESNELENVKSETEVMRQENDLETAVEGEVNIIKKSENVGDLPIIHKIENKSEEKNKEVESTVGKQINKLNSSESDEQLIIQNTKHKSDDSEIEIETTEKKIDNKLDKSESGDQNTKLKIEPRDIEADITEEEIGNTLNKPEQKSSDQSDIHKIETKDNKEIDNKRTDSIEIDKKEKKTEQAMIEDIKQTILDKPENKVDSAMSSPSENVETIDIQPEIKAAETEVNEKIIVKREIDQMAASKVEIESNEQTSNMSGQTIEGETTDKVKDQMEIIETEHELEKPATGEIEKEIETKEDTIQTSNVKTPVIKIVDETDESTNAKMENIVEEAILAQMIINKMRDESIEEVKMVVNERPTDIVDNESLKPTTESDESRIKDQSFASVNESIEIEGADKHLIFKTSKLEEEEEKTDYIQKMGAEEQTINIKENISNERSIEKLDEMEVEPTVIEIEGKANETIKEILENDVISPIMEKINSKDGKPDDIRLNTVKPDDLNDDKTTEEAKGTIDGSTIVHPECVTDDSIIPKTENMSQKEPSVEVAANNSNALAIRITKAEETHDEPIEIHPESKANELIAESTVNQIKSKDDDLTGESKDVDPTIEIKVDTMGKLIAKTENEPIKHINKQKANELADEAIERTDDEPEIVNLQNIDDQQISVTVGEEDHELAKQMEDPMNEAIVEKLATNELKNIPVNNPTNDPINEPIIKEIKHQDIESSVATLENNVEDINNDAESLIQKIKNKSDDSTVAKIENEVKEIFGIDNESSADIKTTDPEPIMQSKDSKIPSKPTTEDADKSVHSIDKRSIETSSSSTESKDPQIEVAANELVTNEMPSVINAEVNTDGAVFGIVEDPTLGPLDHSSSFAGGTAAIRELVNEFLINEIQYSTQEQSQSTEVQEEPCIKKTASITNLSESLETIKSPETKRNDSSDVMLSEKLTHGESMELDTFATDTLDKATLKLLKPEKTIEKMSQRQVSESLDKDNLPTEPSFKEPIIKSMGSLQEQANMDIEDGDLIIYKRLQREDTRESSAQSDSVVFGETNDEDAERQGSANKIDAETTRVQFTRHYTIAGDDPRRMFRTIDDDGESDFEAAPLIDSTSSFCLDDETSEAIRKKILAYSLSETDSDYFDPNKVITDDSYIDTAMADDAMGTSTETESTIVSAATKIQAGARGFLTRRRLRRASAGTKSSTQETKASFGNDAISESLERFIEEEAAKKIQAAYRIHTRKQNRRKNKLEGASLESSLAARRQKLQRGDALRNDSTPDDDNSARTSINATNGPQVEKLSKKHRSEATAEEHKKPKINMELKWPVLRQNSMPVQIDCEVLRVIPKHLRKRIKSAESQKKNRK